MPVPVSYIGYVRYPYFFRMARLKIFFYQINYLMISQLVQIIALYNKGMSIREIAESIQEMYRVDISSELVSRITDKILESIAEG